KWAGLSVCRSFCSPRPFCLALSVHALHSQAGCCSSSVQGLGSGSFVRRQQKRAK
ncbi:hypothetical protein L0F63_006329, partial [Massospora cicadina]